MKGEYASDFGKWEEGPEGAGFPLGEDMSPTIAISYPRSVRRRNIKSVPVIMEIPLLEILRPIFSYVECVHYLHSWAEYIARPCPSISPEN
jgi:hypothetical protein